MAIHAVELTFARKKPTPLATAIRVMVNKMGVFSVFFFGVVTLCLVSTPAYADESKDQMISNLRAIHNEISGTLARALDDPTIPTLETGKRLNELLKQISEISNKAGAANLAVDERYGKLDNEFTRIEETSHYLFDEASSIYDFLDNRDGLYSSAAKDADSIVDRLETQ